jgi:hypothetical protein
MALSSWTVMRNPGDDAIPGERGVFVVLLEPPIVEGPRHFVHLSWQGEHYVLRDYLNNLSRKQGDDLPLAALWRAARERIACKGRLRRSVDDHKFWEEELRRLTDAYAGHPDSVHSPGLEVPGAVKPERPRPIGLAKRAFAVPPEFFAPLPDDLLDAFQGEKGKS